MPHSDFDLPGLARYLHLSPDKVAKLADRGQLPGRKVGGEWKFSKADIHHWLERRIGASDEVELLEVEGVLSASAPIQPARDRNLNRRVAAAGGDCRPAGRPNPQFGDRFDG